MSSAHPSQLPNRRQVLGAFGLSIAGLSLASCTSEPTPQASTDLSGGAAPIKTFRIAAPANALSLDPVLAQDGESFRVSRQILECLVGIDPVTSQPTPLLAESWTESVLGLSYTFTLRQGVIFHDGEPFNAEAVKANFDRWFSLSPALRSRGAGTAFESLFGSFKGDSAYSAFAGCDVLDEFRVRISLTRRLTPFIKAMASQPFAMSSPAALIRFRADAAISDETEPLRTAYSTQPVGTGPFRFVSWKDETIRLGKFTQYWGESGNVDAVEIKTLSSPAARVRQLDSGEVDAIDLITVPTYILLLRSGKNILQRDPFSVFYLGINSEFAPLDKLGVRQAIYHAINKDDVMRDVFLKDSKSANTFFPPKLGVPTDDIPGYGFDQNKAKELLDSAGYQGETLPFYYPLEVNRSYMPSPEILYARLSAQLVAVGLNIQPVPIRWEDGYLERIGRDSNRALYLGGFTGSYDDPNTFISPLFAAKNTELGFSDQQLFDLVAKGRTQANGEDRLETYRQISVAIAEKVPAIPIAFPVSALAVSPRVGSYPVSPVLDESYSKIQLTE